MLVISSLCTVTRLRSQLPQAQKWEEAWMWKEGECSVLNTGVACITGIDFPGSTACSGHQSSRFQASLQTNAVCPGSYWCSEEGELCSCTGQVTYATKLFNGHQYTYNTDEHREFSVTAAQGFVTCGNNTAGQKLRDPAPGKKKNCWCTPEQVLALFGPNSRLHRQKCTAQSTAAFAAATSSSPEQSVRHMSAKGNLSVEEDAASRAGDHGQGKEVDARRLVVQHRPKFAFTPWALVNVTLPDDGFLAQDSSRLVCAYEYGVPEASFFDYQGSVGLLSGAAALRAEKVLEDWGSRSRQDCWVRIAGSSDMEDVGCTVAMDMPGTLTEKRRNQLGVAYPFLCVTVALLMLCGVCWIALAWQGA